MTTVAVTAEGSRGLEALYREDGDRLWRALLAFAGDSEIASDAVAEAFAQVMRRGDAVRNPRAWIWRAGFRIAAGELKRRSSTTDRMPDVGYLSAEVDADLLEALAQLPGKQRAAVILFYYADASVRDIAARIGISQVSVRVHLSRGRSRLKALLGEHDG
jgi:RNA polymerase sigma-70 factor (ECF subfamily)